MDLDSSSVCASDRVLYDRVLKKTQECHPDYTPVMSEHHTDRLVVEVKSFAEGVLSAAKHTVGERETELYLATPGIPMQWEWQGGQRVRTVSGLHRHLVDIAADFIKQRYAITVKFIFPPLAEGEECEGGEAGEWERISISWRGDLRNRHRTPEQIAVTRICVEHHEVFDLGLNELIMSYEGASDVMRRKLRDEYLGALQTALENEAVPEGMSTQGYHADLVRRLIEMEWKEGVIFLLRPLDSLSNHEVLSLIAYGVAGDGAQFCQAHEHLRTGEDGPFYTSACEVLYQVFRGSRAPQEAADTLCAMLLSDVDLRYLTNEEFERFQQLVDEHRPYTESLLPRIKAIAQQRIDEYYE